MVFQSSPALNTQSKKKQKRDQATYFVLHEETRQKRMQANSI